MHQRRKRPASIAGRALLGGALACAVLAGPTASASPAPEPSSPAATAFPSQLSRIAAVRVYQGGAWVLPGENARSVGRALASLEPTWASSLLRFQKNEPVTGAEVKAWNTITDMVRDTTPAAEFGIELNSLEYQKPSQIVTMMSKIRTRFDNDGWMMDFYTPAYRRFPKAVQAAIADAHDNGEWIGGNAFGLSDGPKVPPGSDFIAVQDFDFQIDLPAVRKLAEQAPVVYHLGNTPQLAQSDGCQWINKLTTAGRAAFLKRRAGQQATYNFHMSYPVLFPECQRHRDQPSQELIAYNATRDQPMMQTIGRLMDQFTRQ
ncbi:MAG: hypothetical protein QOI10_2417 [Solirubrobacterales bacterium]|jgi:hypothetical protein|nr:hypothetical protein [Solirubrobacterales bacterium]